MQKLSLFFLILVILLTLFNLPISGQQTIDGFSGTLLYLRQASDEQRELVHQTRDSRQIFSLMSDECFQISDGSAWEGQRDYVLVSSQENPQSFRIYTLSIGLLILEYPWDQAWGDNCRLGWIGTAMLALPDPENQGEVYLLDILNEEISGPYPANDFFPTPEPECVLWVDPYQNFSSILGMYCDEFAETIPDFDPENDVYIGTPNLDWVIIWRCIEYEADRCENRATVLLDISDNEVIEVLRNAPSLWLYYTGIEVGVDQFAWSPSGVELAYLQVVEAGMLLVVFDTVTLEYRHEVTIEGDYRSSIPGLVWSPDGQKLAFVIRPMYSDDQQLAIFNVGNGEIFVDPEIRSYEVSTQSLRWSPDSQSIIYIEPETDLLQFFHTETYQRNTLDDGIIRILSWE